MIPIIVASIIFFDQLTKFLATKLLPLNAPVSIIDNFFNLTLVHNKGAAFGILKEQVVFFILVTLAAIVIIALSLKAKDMSRLYKVALAFMLAGAIGNLIDRVFFGYVIDFLDFRIWPVFNIADSFITIGAVFFGYHTLFKK
ncbi:MAG: signal peptidase II [Candidatus Omnitrophota bacterium]|jgi:signal peptidase II